MSNANEGFQRELERITLLFNELQSEYLSALEEKKKHNEAMLIGAGIEEKDLKKANYLAKETSKKKLELLLPRIKYSHLDANM